MTSFALCVLLAFMVISFVANHRSVAGYAHASGPNAIRILPGLQLIFSAKS